MGACYSAASSAQGGPVVYLGFLSSEWKLDWLIRPWIYLKNNIFLLLFIQRMNDTNTVTPKELCQLVRDAHSRISASIIKTRWSLIFQQSELEIIAIRNWITSVQQKEPGLKNSWFLHIVFPPIQEVKTSQGCGFSSNVIHRPLHSLLKDGTGKSLFLWTPFYSVSNSQPIFNILQEQRTGSFKLRGAHSKLSKMTQREVRIWYTFISNLVVFMFVIVKCWRGSTEKDCTGRLLGDLKLWQPRAGLHRCHEEVSSSVSFK